MRKSTRNQLTGGEETPGENALQRALLPCCWGPCAAAVVGGNTGTGDDWAEDGAGSAMEAGAGEAGGLVVGHDGPQVEGYSGVLIRRCSTLVPQMFQKGASSPETPQTKREGSVRVFLRSTYGFSEH